MEKINPAMKNKPIGCIRGYLVCSDHFHPSQYTTEERVRLNRGVVPSVGLPELAPGLRPSEPGPAAPDPPALLLADRPSEKVICQNIENEYTSQLLSGIKTGGCTAPNHNFLRYSKYPQAVHVGLPI